MKSVPSAAPSATPTHPTYEPKLASVAAVIADATRLAYRCLDWSARRDHMAGKLPKALLVHCLQQGWLRRCEGERALEVTPLGRKHLVGLLPSVNVL